MGHNGPQGSEERSNRRRRMMGQSGVILVQESITPPTGCAEVRMYISNNVLVRLLFTPFHPISPHFTSFYSISPLFTPFHPISPHFTPFHPILLHFTPFHPISPLPGGGADYIVIIQINFTYFSHYL
jgi:hypothetical protein